MRKDRNTFFSEANMFQSNYPQQPMMNPQMMQQPMMNPAPYQQSSASNSFYQGPMPSQVPTSPNPNVSDFESRMAKIERQIRRLETRVNKLEGSYGPQHNMIEDNDTNISTNMYMI